MPVVLLDALFEVWGMEFQPLYVIFIRGLLINGLLRSNTFFHEGVELLEHRYVEKIW